MNQNETVLNVDSKIYNLEAIYKACYHFLENFYIRLEGDPQGTIKIFIRPKSGTPHDKDIVGEIQNELLHQSLRHKILKETQKLREYVITKALSSAEGTPTNGDGNSGGGAASPALDPELEKEIEKLLAEVEKADSTKDPLKIGTPWEENHLSGDSSSPKNS
jgi:His-Xaa-Ser system protein HxsD